MRSIDLTLYLVTDQNVPWQTCLSVVHRAVLGGVTAVQLREKNKPKYEVRRRAKDLLRVLESSRVPLIVNDHVDIAKEVGAQGVHLGKSDCSARDARGLLGPKAVIGLSVEDTEILDAHIIDECDYLSASPVFPTLTKDDAAPPLGMDGLMRLRALYDLPLVAIGGIGLHNCRELGQTKIDGVCVVSAIFLSADPEMTARNLKAQFTLGRSSYHV